MSGDAPTPRRKGSCLITGLVVLLLAGTAAGAAWWWQNRPIQPVTLSVAEIQTIEGKIGSLEDTAPPEPGTVRPDPVYEPGSREIIITERELNGLLHHNTGLGDKLKFELVPGAVHARVETDLDPELPIVGGRKLKARARFFVTHDASGSRLVIDDVTVWGISLPNEWLGGLKGRDLIGEALGPEGRPGLAGVESIELGSGTIRIQLRE